MLERLGYEVVIQTSSLATLDTFLRDPNRFDAVITDQTMPGMTGIELAEKMMRIRPDKGFPEIDDFNPTDFYY